MAAAAFPALTLEGLPCRQRLQALRQCGVRRLVNVSGVDLAAIYGAETLAPFEVSAHVFADVFADGSPVLDTAACPEVDADLYLRAAPDRREREQLLGAIAAVHAALEQAEPVFLFCHAGRSRSPLVAMAALLRDGRISPAASIARVRTLQPRLLLTDIGLAALRWSLECPATAGGRKRHGL